MLSNFLIGLREGLEAALIVGILVAYANKTDRKDWVRKIFIGVGAAVALSVLAGFLLNALVQNPDGGTNELIAGSASIIAVGFVTWMIFWMANNAKNLSGEMKARMDASKSSVLSVVAIAFFAVIREGIETSIFLWSSVSASGQGSFALLGAFLGLVVATWLGYLIYRGALKMNLTSFFKYTGAFLIIVAAGILAYGVHELQEIGLLPVLTQTSYDLSGVIPEDSLIEVVLSGTISFRAAPSMLESVVWFAYVAVVGWLFARAYRKPAKKN